MTESISENSFIHSHKHTYTRTTAITTAAVQRQQFISIAAHFFHIFSSGLSIRLRFKKMKREKKINKNEKLNIKTKN